MRIAIAGKLGSSVSVALMLLASCVAGCSSVGGSGGGGADRENGQEVPTTNTAGSEDGSEVGDTNGAGGVSDGANGPEVPPRDNAGDGDIPVGGDNDGGGETGGSDGSGEGSSECESEADCEDSNPCTSDRCVVGRCDYSANTSDCDDGNACTTDDVCSDGACAGTPLECGRGEVCRDGGCVDDGNTEPPPPSEDPLVLDLGEGITMELVLIPAGTFTMGTDSEDFAWLEHSRPVHTVSIGRSFYIGKYEVTQSQWRSVMGTAPSSFIGDERPVESVSWDDAVAFADAMASMTGYIIRLPSEAEWEYACRAGTTTEYHYGDAAAELDSYGWHAGNSDFATHDVGGKQPNAWGLFDMHGNVWEWCEDVWHDDYIDAPSDADPWTTDGDSTRRVMRGGSWEDDGASLLRSAARKPIRPSGLRGNQGFRVAAER